MPSTLANPSPASHREPLASVRGTRVKADLVPQVTASDLREIAGRVIRRVHGKMLVAAEAVDVSESQIGRLVNDGDLKLKQLEALGPATLAELGKELVEAYGTLSNPDEYALRALELIESKVNELRQYVQDRKRA